MATAAKKTSAKSKADAKGQSGPVAPKPADFTKEQELAAYRDMLLIRRFEEKAGQLYGMGFIGGFCHLYIGQEAVVTGVKMALIEGDQMITAYRDHGHMLAMGMTPRGVMAELTGRHGGLLQGQGRLDAHVLQGEEFLRRPRHRRRAGVAGHGPCFRQPYRGNKNVSLTYFGDGAANQGQVYESFNMASLWKLPVIYIIENNRYAHGHLGQRSSAETDFSHARRLVQASPACRSTAWTSAVNVEPPTSPPSRARSGKGPYILEMLTYRYRGHSMSDPAKYRSKDEVAKMRAERDPIEQVKTRILDKRYGTEEEPEGDRDGDPRHRHRGRRLRARRSRAGRVRALDRHLRSIGEAPANTWNPMPTILMPALSPDHGRGQCSRKWLVKEGDTVKSRRRNGRDRDRQGDDGGRSGR